MYTATIINHNSVPYELITIIECPLTLGLCTLCYVKFNSIDRYLSEINKKISVKAKHYIPIFLKFPVWRAWPSTGCSHVVPRDSSLKMQQEN